MAWQSGPVTNGGGAMAPGESGGVQAYTLQGVMRFLQTEWHRHERDRNAWEIEREEMKKRIAGLEGEARTSKGLRGALEKHVKILELALKKEREKIKELSRGELVDVQPDARTKAKEELRAVGKGISHFDTEIDRDNHLAQGVRQEKERDKSQSYLGKCSSEITYHVLPTSHIPPEVTETLTSNAVFQGRQPSQQELVDAYLQLQQQKQQQLSQPPQPPQQQHQPQQPPSIQTQQLGNQSRGKLHLDPDVVVNNYDAEIPSPYPDGPPPNFRSNTQIHHGIPQVREVSDVRRVPDQTMQPLTALDNRKTTFSDENAHGDEPVETITHVVDRRGRDITSKNEGGNGQPIEIVKTDVGDEWDFGDGPGPTEIPQETTSHHRQDLDPWPSAANSASMPSKSPPRGSNRRKSSGTGTGIRKRSDGGLDTRDSSGNLKADASQFKVRFAMRGHLDVVRCIIFTGGGSPSEPEFCTGSDDGGVKRWHIPAPYSHSVPLGDDLDRIAHFTHRGHLGAVCSLAACPASPNFSNGGRASGDGWIFSGGQDASVKVWERGRVDAKASLEGHKEAVWALCVLPGTAGSILGDRSSQFGGPDRVLLAAGAADGTILIWAVSAPPQLNSPHAGSNRGARGSRRANSISAGSNFPSSPQASVATNTPFHYSLVHRIERHSSPSPTSIAALSPTGQSFVVGYNDASVLVFDARTGEEIVGMASQETYDGTANTGVNAVVASSTGFDASASITPNRRGSMGEEDVVHGATGSEGGVEGLVIAGYEDRFIRFFDANSGQCTYTMLAHPSAISSLSMSPDGRELVSGGHDASLRFWSLEKRNCTQEITSHRIMRGEGVCAVVWSPDGRWVISCGGDGAVKVFSRS